jgi:O-antigen ligase
MISLAYAALCIFVFSIPWEDVVRISGVSIATKLTGALALGLAVLAAAVSGRVRRWHTFHRAALLFVIWAGAAQLFFHFGEPLPGKFLTFVQLFLVLWMIWELAVSRRRQLGLMTAYVLGAYVAALDTFILYQKEGGSLRRFAAGGGDPNELAMLLALALPMAWYLGMTHRRTLIRWVCRGYLPLGLVAIGLTSSRGGMLVSMTGLLIVPLTMTKLTPGRLIAAVAILALSGAAAVTYIPETSLERLATTGAEVEDARFGGRLKLWVAGVEAFMQKPVLGHGTSSFILVVKPRLGSLAQVAHNSYLSLLVEQGIVGFLLYMSMLIAVFLSLLRLPALERRFTLVLLAALALAMFPLTWEHSKAAWCVLALILGLSQASAGWTRGAAREPAPLRAVPPRGPLVAPRPLEPSAYSRIPGRGGRA